MPSDYQIHQSHERAQAAYDAMLPPDGPSYCDGCGDLLLDQPICTTELTEEGLMMEAYYCQWCMEEHSYTRGNHEY